MTSKPDNRETWRIDTLAANIPHLLANDSVPVRFGDRYGWIALPRELATQIVADHNQAQLVRELTSERDEALQRATEWQARCIAAEGRRR